MGVSYFCCVICDECFSDYYNNQNQVCAKGFGNLYMCNNCFNIAKKNIVGFVLNDKELVIKHGDSVIEMITGEKDDEKEDEKNECLYDVYKGEEIIYEDVTFEECCNMHYDWVDCIFKDSYAEDIIVALKSRVQWLEKYIKAGEAYYSK